MKHSSRCLHRRRRGGGLIVAMVTLLVVTSMMGSVIRSLLVEMRQGRQEAAELQSHWLAEAAIERAAAQLRSNSDYSGETWTVDLSPVASSAASPSGIVEIHVERDGDGQPMRVAVEARYPDDPRRRAKVDRVLIIPVKNTNSRETETRQENVP